MKLILCTTCGDIFKLARGVVRSCECGTCRGKYDDDGHYAVTNGEGVSLAIGNGSLMGAIRGDATFECNSQYTNEPLKTFLAWVRPHDGPNNPHSRVERDL